MYRSLKVPGLALLAALTFSLIAASTASALAHHVTVTGASSADLKVSANGVQKFWTETEGGDLVECQKATVKGSLPAVTNSTVLVEPQYTECEAKKGESSFSAKVTNNGCYYTFHGKTTTDQTKNNTARVDLTCPPGTGIVITVTAFNFSCIEINTQTTKLHGITYAQAVSGDVTVDAKVHNLHVKTVKSIACEEGEHTDGKYEGHVTIDGDETETGKEVNLSLTQTSEEEEVEEE